MTFITDDFLLNSDTARELYHNYAKEQPIIDYHCHLPPGDVARNRRFNNLHEIWLEGDHYKWRAMRANGENEHYCTGDADAKEKFLAYARTLPNCLRNPLYHWSHLELKRYFDIDTLLGPDTAEEIWEETCAKLQAEDMSAHGILGKFKVSVVCTTDDPVDDLADHKTIAQSGIGTRVYPTFRPDKAMKLGDLSQWNTYMDELARVSGVDCGKLSDFKEAMKKRHDFFHAMGGRLSDHGIEACPEVFPTEEEAARIYDRARARKALLPEEGERLAAHMLEFFGELDAEKNWTKQLHLGAMRNVNQRMFEKRGPDVGCDSISDEPQGKGLAAYLGKLAASEKLPKTVLYNLNPRDNYLFATMIGNFQDGEIAGKMQFGSGWWFLDQKEGMTWQMNALSNLGLFGRFVGMLTDSRSFMSYCRHEYFRRLLCDLVGGDAERGELPMDMELLGGLVANISYHNAASFFGFDLGNYQPSE